jgi:4-hydroxybenzoate polyprenyltransferase
MKSIASNYKSKWLNYIQLMRWDKPIGILLLLWPTLMALWITGKGHPDPKLVTIFVLGVIIMRSAGCVINDFADRDFDKKVTRTKNRPLATQQLSVNEAIICFLLLIFIAFLLVLQLNIQTILLSAIGLLLAIIYPFLKRFTHLPQVVLGAAFSWGIILVFSAFKQKIPNEAWVLFLANLCWIMVYDTQYAMADRADDIQIGVKSTAILFGKADLFWVGFFQILALSLFILLGIILFLGPFYFLGILIAGILMIYQQLLIKNRQSENCFKAFLNNNYVGLALFIGLCIAKI